MERVTKALLVMSIFLVAFFASSEGGRDVPTSKSKYRISKPISEVGRDVPVSKPKYRIPEPISREGRDVPTSEPFFWGNCQIPEPISGGKNVPTSKPKYRIPEPISGVGRDVPTSKPKYRIPEPISGEEMSQPLNLFFFGSYRIPEPISAGGRDVPTSEGGRDVQISEPLFLVKYQISEPTTEGGIDVPTKEETVYNPQGFGLFPGFGGYGGSSDSGSARTNDGNWLFPWLHSHKIFFPGFGGGSTHTVAGLQDLAKAENRVGNVPTVDKSGNGYP